MWKRKHRILGLDGITLDAPCPLVKIFLGSSTNSKYWPNKVCLSYFYPEIGKTSFSSSNVFAHFRFLVVHWYFEVLWVKGFKIPQFLSNSVRCSKMRGNKEKIKRDSSKTRYSLWNRNGGEMTARCQRMLHNWLIRALMPAPTKHSPILWFSAYFSPVDFI